jgi:hypothetical protein
MFVDHQKMLKEVLSTLSWAVYLPNYYSSEEDMPQAYIVLLLDKNGLTPVHDASIASMSISIIGYDEDLGSCIMTSFAREKLREVLNVPEGITIELVVASRYQAENPVIEIVKNADTKYGT